jgi:membrane protease YdiL (CAAX protease family)
MPCLKKFERIAGVFKMNSVTSFTRKYPTAVFFILTYILSWGGNQITDTVWESTQSIPLALPLALLSAAPLSAVLIVSAMIGGRVAVLTLLRKLTVWKVGWRWYVVAFLLQPALNLGAIYLNVLLGAPAPTVAAFGSWSALLGAFALRLVNPFDGPMLEELGWRGFAQPRLQERFSPLIANLILAFLVTLWHLRLIPSGDYAWIYIPATIAVTILYAWVYNATGGSVLLTLIMHATEPMINVNFSGVYETQYVMLRVTIYAMTALIVVILTGKNLGQKETVSTQTEMENLAATA